jgi:hypothetical protein
LAGQDVLDKTKDVIIDEPKDWIEDALDVDKERDTSDVSRHKASAHQRQCGSEWTRIISRGMSQPAETVKLDDLIDHKEDFYGKTVTVDGEMHRTFTESVFTIEDDDFFQDDDVLVINTVPGTDLIVPLRDSLERGKMVRITGVVRPYDRGELECEYGPLNLESREGHSFTKSPVLVIGRPEVVEETRVESPPVLSEKPEPPAVLMKPEPEPAIAEPEPAPTPAPAPLPQTGGNLPLAGLLGLLSLSAACVSRLFAGSRDH